MKRIFLGLFLVSVLSLHAMDLNDLAPDDWVDVHMAFVCDGTAEASSDISTDYSDFNDDLAASSDLLGDMHTLGQSYSGDSYSQTGQAANYGDLSGSGSSSEHYETLDFDAVLRNHADVKELYEKIRNAPIDQVNQEIQSIEQEINTLHNEWDKIRALPPKTIHKLKQERTRIRQHLERIEPRNFIPSLLAKKPNPILLKAHKKRLAWVTRQLAPRHYIGQEIHNLHLKRFVALRLRNERLLKIKQAQELNSLSDQVRKDLNQDILDEKPSTLTDQRRKAIEYTQAQKGKITSQTKKLSIAHRALLVKFGFGPEKFQEFSGNKIQQQFFNEAQRSVCNATDFYVRYKNIQGVEEYTQNVFEAAGEIIEASKNGYLKAAKALSDGLQALQQVAGECATHKKTFFKGFIKSAESTYGLELIIRGSIKLLGLSAQAGYRIVQTLARAYNGAMSLQNIKEEYPFLDEATRKVFWELTAKQRVEKIGEFIGAGGVMARHSLWAGIKRSCRSAIDFLKAEAALPAIEGPFIVEGEVIGQSAGVALEGITSESTWAEWLASAEIAFGKTLSSAQKAELQAAFNRAQLYQQKPLSSLITEAITGEELLAVTPEGIKIPITPTPLLQDMGPQAPKEGEQAIATASTPKNLSKDPIPHETVAAEAQTGNATQEAQATAATAEAKTGNAVQEAQSAAATPKNLSKEPMTTLEILEQQEIDAIQAFGVPAKKLEDGVIAFETVNSRGKKVWRSIVLQTDKQLDGLYRYDGYAHTLYGEVSEKGHLAGQHQGKSHPWRIVKKNGKIDYIFENDQNGLYKVYVQYEDGRIKPSTMIPDNWSISDFSRAIKEVYQNPLKVIKQDNGNILIIGKCNKGVPFAIVVKKVEINGITRDKLVTAYPYHDDDWKRLFPQFN